jgi:hypothetical protein
MSTRFLPISWTSPWTVASYDGALLGTCLFLHLWLEISDCLLHHRDLPRPVEWRCPAAPPSRARKPAASCPEQVPHGFRAFELHRRLAREFNFFMQNLVQRTDLGVVDNGLVEAMIHRLGEEDRVQNTPQASRPKEILLNPRMVLTAGSSLLIRLMAWSVSMPALRYSSCPVEIGRVSASKIKSTGRTRPQEGHSAQRDRWRRSETPIQQFFLGHQAFVNGLEKIRRALCSSLPGRCLSRSATRNNSRRNAQNAGFLGRPASKSIPTING